MTSDLSGVCFVCGCTEPDPCLIPGPFGRVMPCSWANEEKTLCTNPECLAEAFACEICGIDVRNHTPLMEAGCVLREARIVGADPRAILGPRLVTV